MTRDGSGGEIKPKAESRHKVTMTSHAGWMDVSGEIFPLRENGETSLILSHLHPLPKI